MQPGATDVTAGRRWNYFCDSGGWVLGMLNRSKQGWGGYFSDSNISADVHEVAVAHVWY